MSATKNSREAVHTDHIISSKDKRAARRAEDLLRRSHDVYEDDWDDYDLSPKEHRFSRNQKLV